MNPHDIPELDARGLRRFGLTFAGIVAVLFGLVLPWLFDRGLPWWPWAFGALVSVWSLAAPASLRPFYRGWMRFGLLLNAVMSRLVLGVVFYVVVLPIGLVLRLRGHDPMARRLDPDASSYRVDSPKQRPNHMEKPF